MLDFLRELHPSIAAALISAAVALIMVLLSTPLRYALDRQALRHRLRTEYEYEQRKQVRQLIGRYVGRMLEATDRLNRRLWNLYANKSRGWLDINGNYENLQADSYYFNTTVYRFLEVCALIRQFEVDALFLDPRIVEKTDVIFVRYLKALYWVLTDVQLFQGIQYDDSRQTDHFFIDNLRLICDACWSNDRFFSLRDFPVRAASDETLRPVLLFFDGLKPGEPRLRWDRLVTFDLLLMAFLNAFGDDSQRSTDEKFLEAVRHVENPEVLENLVQWLPRIGLGKQREVRHIFKAARAA